MVTETELKTVKCLNCVFSSRINAVTGECDASRKRKKIVHLSVEHRCEDFKPFMMEPRPTQRQSFWKLKACPRCTPKGDLLVENNNGSWTETCLQCGYQRDLRQTTIIDKKSNEQVH